MTVKTFDTPATLARGAAEFIVARINDVLNHQDRFTLALSGGSTPNALYELLAKPPFSEQIPWAQLHIFWGDERAVPLDDPQNNAGVAYEKLLGNVYTPDSQIHVWETDLTPEAAAADYDRLLHTYFTATGPTFDLVLLGLGDDGHTLSLFPGTEVVHEKTAWTRAFRLDAQQMHRLTLTASVVNRASAVLFLVAGDKKTNALREVLHGDYQPDLYPAQVIKPAPGKLLWFVDKAAAGEGL
jgi:6-phosphogluconolactonase